MSRKKKTPKDKSSNSSKQPTLKTAASKPIRWRKLIERAVFALAILGIISFSVAAYMDKVADDRDLSVIGNGIATVVQIHDPSCQLCRQLKSNLDSVKGDFKDKIQFKIANIQSKEGREFAAKHRVQHVTLLFFDQRGRRVDTIQGVTPAKDIEAELAQLAGNN